MGGGAPTGPPNTGQNHGLCGYFDILIFGYLDIWDFGILGLSGLVGFGGIVEKDQPKYTLENHSSKKSKE